MIVSVVTNKTKTRDMTLHGSGALPHIMTRHDYSLITFNNNYRVAKNFKQADAFGLDFDDGMTLIQAKEAFKDYKHIIATTRSHNKKKNGIYANRFRVVLFFDETVTSRAIYEATVKSWLKKFPKADIKCKDAARYFYKSTEIISNNTHGTRVTPESALKVLKAPKSKYVDFNKKPLGFTNCMWNIANGNFGPGDRNEALMSLATNLKGLGYTKEQSYYFCKDACEKRGDEFDSDEIWNKIVGYVYSNDFGSTKYNCKTETTWLHDYCSDLGDNACSKGRRGFSVKKLSEFWKEDHKVEWFVNELLSKGGVSIFTGDPKAGKSTIVRQLIKATTVGGFFLGRKVQQGRVLYLALEESSGLLKYQLKKCGITGDEDVFITVGKPDVEHAAEALAELMRELDPTLVVVDTLGHIFNAEDFNNYSEVQNVFTEYREIVRRSGAHLMFIHHNNKGGDMLGSQAFKGGTDCNMSLMKMGDTRKITTEQRGGKSFNRQEILFDADTETYSIGSSTKVKTPGGF